MTAAVLRVVTRRVVFDGTALAKTKTYGSGGWNGWGDMKMTMHKRVLLLLSMGLALPAALATPARARVGDGLVMRQGLSGSAELGYTSYEASEQGRKVLDASSFVQKYSLLYKAVGKARYEGSGNYSVTLGYEWASVDASVSSPHATSDQSVRSGRLLYDARFNLNPPQSPYQLSAYSTDMGRGNTITDSLPLLSNGGGILAPGLVTDLTHTGINIASGARLVIASRPGLLGKANEILADVPAVIIDYHDQLNRNTEGGNRLDSRLSRLNVSAGGRGDTWLHYQGTDFSDKFNQDNNFSTTRIMFGTIDQYRRRKWVQFTNWIKLSADARFEQKKYGSSDKNEEEFDLNLFGTATRRLWEAKIFSNYNRKVVGAGAPAETLRLPLYVRGVLGADSDWSLSVSTAETRTGGVNNQSSRSSSDSLTARLKTFKRSPFVLSTALTLTNESDSGGGGQYAADLGVETFSTTRFARTASIAGSYNLRTTYNKGRETYGYNQELLLTSHYQPSSHWKLSLRESLVQGKNDGSSSGLASSLAGQGQNPLGTSTGLSVPAADYLRLSTILSAAWTPTARFTANLSGANYVEFGSAGSDGMTNSMEAGLRYQSPTFSAGLSGSTAVQDTGDSQYSGSVEAAYMPNRTINANLRGRLGQRKSGDVTYRLVDAAQRLTYYIWGSRGISRKVADLYEELAYIQENGETPKKSLTLAGVYYLYARISLNGRATYALQNGDLSQVYGFGLAANMKLLDATVDYTYAKRSSDKRVENRLAATLKKAF